MKFRQLIGHFCTITHHRHKVIAGCARAGILFQGLFHDLSKYAPAEFIPSVKYYVGTRSPNDLARKDLGYSSAWLHHKGRNRHHFEYWTDYSPHAHAIAPVRMPAKYVAEMFCDRVAASKIYMKENYSDRAPLDYFEKGKGHRFIHPETSHEIEKMLTILANEGEDAAFSYVRAYVKESKKKK